MVTPASEKGMLFTRLPRSAGFQYCPPVCVASCLQQLAILLGMKILRDAVHALERQNVAAQSPSPCRLRIARCAVTSVKYAPAFGADPRRLKLSRVIGHRRHLHQRADAARALKYAPRLSHRGAGLYCCIANFGGERHGAVIEQHLRRHRRGHVARRIGHHPAQ